MILGLRTDKPEAELYLINGEAIQDTYTWVAHRQLSDTLINKIEAFIKKNKLDRSELTGIVAYAGPGSFTGLRIGLSVANSLAYALQIPIASGTHEEWLDQALAQLKQANAPQVIVPEYGAEVNITQPRK